MAIHNDVGSIHTYDFDRESLMPVGWYLVPPLGAPAGFADVIVHRQPTRHGTWWHTTVRMRIEDVRGHDRHEVLYAAQALAGL